MSPSADWAVSWYRVHGFVSDRTRKNQHGYPGFLRELVQKEPEELDSGPLHEYVLKELGITHDTLPAEVSSHIEESRAQSEQERQALANALGSDGLDAVFDAVFDFDEFSVAAGVPDILVWLHTPNESCWFFSEVKAPGDSLRPSQAQWLGQHWALVRGHYLLTLLE